MTEEERRDTERDEPRAEETAEQPEAAEEAVPEEPEEGPEAGEEPEEQPEAEPPESAAEQEPQGAPEEELTPKQRRRLERSRAPGPPRPQRSPEERARERAELRRRQKERRRRYRHTKRAKRGEPRVGTPPASRDRPSVRKVRTGRVVSSRADKTITVEIEIARRHRGYEKVVRSSRTLHAHDERNEANEGDLVKVVESRPISRRKRWRLVEIVARAPMAVPEPAEEAAAAEETTSR